jgi:predicted ATP-dependent endonuclease of OLD family
MRLAGLLVKNYRRIGNLGCQIKIDEIVVLIGPNNAGKSTILDAYEAFASSGAELEVSHFHNEDQKMPVEITGIFDSLTKDDLDVIGEKWAHEDCDYGTCIKVRWVWSQAGEKGKKQSFDPTIGDFIDGGSGGWDSLIKSRIPQPIRIRPTDPVDITQTKIVAMLKEHVKQQLKAESGSTKDAFDEIERLAAKLFAQSKVMLDEISTKITENVSEVFPGATIEVVPRSKDTIDEKVIAADSYLRVATVDGGNTPLALQGTGLQRALLWSALSVMSEPITGKKKTKTSSDAGKILLIDEPEAFLHPPTIRSARESLYQFALDNSDWQVIATTHSPVFIDLSKDHTTIVRVDASSGKQRYISTDKASFDADEKKRLQMVRSCNPIVNEFFFYDNIVLVEGDTEQVIVKYVADQLGIDVHVINCIGKANIPLFARILNQFKVVYTVIHDSDTPMCKRKEKIVGNPMWSINEAIRVAVSGSPGSKIFTQFQNFESEFFNDDLTFGKVDNAISAIADSDSEEGKKIIETYTKLLSGDTSILTTSIEAFNAKLQKHLIAKELSTDWRWN